MNCLDDLPKARVTFESYSAVCVAIAHPSMPNAFQRRSPFQGIEGEILLLKEARIEAEDNLLKSEFVNSESPASSMPESMIAHRPDGSSGALRSGRRRGKGLHLQFERAFRSRVGRCFLGEKYGIRCRRCSPISRTAVLSQRITPNRAPIMSTNAGSVRIPNFGSLIQAYRGMEALV